MFGVSSVIGREAELEAIERYLDALPSGPSALVIDGEAGIGKTTLWVEAMRAAEARDYRVLRARPAESEARLSYGGLADLVGGAFDDTRADLPPPQEHALGVALLRADSEEAADPRTTATGLASVVAILSSDRPLVLAIDDVQWLDPDSARAVGFAARRLPPNVGLLVTRRSDGGAEAPLGLARALPADRLERLSPTRLSVAALHHLIAGRLGSAPSRPTLLRVAAVSGGNPFFALEIAHSLARDSSDRRLGDPLPIPASLQEAVLARVRELPAAAQEAVLVAASLSRPTATAVAEALGPQRDAVSALVAAEEANVLVSERERLRFTHPLLASAVYGAASESRRRQLHGRLAEVVTDPEDRARHLASSVIEADEATAAEIENAARAAVLRGAHDAAAELFDAAGRLTPPNRVEELARRTLGRGWAIYELGDLGAARSLAARAVGAAPTASLRVQALLLLIDVEWEAGALASVLEHLDACLSAVRDAPDLQGEVYSTVVNCTIPLALERATEYAAVAERLLSEEREPEQLASVRFNHFFAEAMLGHEPLRELLERALELEALGSPKHHVPIIWFLCTDDLDAARARQAIEDEWRRQRGHERLRADRLAYLGVAELRAGNLDLAEEYAERSCAMAEQRDTGRLTWGALSSRSLVDAQRGRVTRARSTLLGLLEDAEQAGTGAWAWRLLSTLGFVEFSAGDHEAVDRALTRMWDGYDAIGVKEPLLDWSEPFHIESLVVLGELDRARETLARLEQRGRSFPRLWIDVTLPRARALVLAAEGRHEAALAALEELDVDAAARLPLELGWALLVKGRLLRRMKQRRSAADALHDALEIFERLGAPAWADQARSELARVGPRRRAPDELTATELRVAELAASGLTNREVAKAAFISAKTVEANLARVYRKLGIHSRAELGARMGDREDRGKAKT